MKLAHCLLPFLLAVRAAPASADELTDLLPPDTKVVFGIRVHNLAASSLVRSFTDQLQAAGPGWLKTIPLNLNGFDLLRDIDEVMIASTGQGKTPTALIVATGRFDAARLAAGGKTYHDVPLWGGQKDTDSMVALLDNSTAITGDPALVRAAIDHRGDNTKIESALSDRIGSLRQRYDVWGVGERPEGFIAPTPETKGLEMIDSFQFGMRLASGLELEAEIHAHSGEDAKKLNASLQLLAAMLKTQQPSDSATKFDLRAEGGTLKLTLSIPEEELKKAIRTETIALSQPSTPAAMPAALGVLQDRVVPVPPVAVASPRKAAPNAATSQVVDKDGNTVILKLPGKK